MIDAYASLSHYAEHLRPVWGALPEGVKGTLYLGPRIAQPGVPRLPRGEGPVTLVASWADLDRIRPRRVILMEHGAGQSYSDRHPAYAGGLERETVDLFLCPGPHCAMRNARFYPETPVVQIGSPALDRWIQLGRGDLPTIPPSARDPEQQARMTRGLGGELAGVAGGTPPSGSLSPGPSVALSWHWNPGNCPWPEARWAWPTFHCALPEFARRFRLVGTGHPRAEDFLRRQYHRLGIPWALWAEVMERASVLVVDNSSAGFEFAATGRPVVWMNSPDYRRDVDHGLRFWSNVGVGYQCDRPERLADVVAGALEELAWKREERLALTPYSHLDGRSAQRAAEAIVSVIEESEAA